MNLKNNQSLLAAAFAFLLATSCCWLPVLAIALGGLSGFAAFSEGLEQYNGIFMALGFAMLAWSGYQFFQNKKNMKQEIIVESTLTCPECNFSKTETMPTDACQFFYECSYCKAVLKPKKGDCCVYCSYGTVACPPIQEGAGCC